jgi:hypothetical protein
MTTEDDFDWDKYQEDLPEVLDEQARLEAELKSLGESRRQSLQLLSRARAAVAKSILEIKSFNERRRAVRSRINSLINRQAEIRRNQRRARAFHDAEKMAREKAEKTPAFMLAARQVLTQEQYAAVWKAVEAAQAEPIENP